MQVKRFEYDLSEGFAWIVIDGKHSDDEITIQCCLTKKNDDDDALHIKSIKMDDCGHNWGLCGDANEESFKYWGQDRCMKALFHYAKNDGFEFE
jgi:hypothetical protein